MNIIAKPKLDLVFKKIFTDTANTNLLIDFLSCVTDIPKDNMLDITIIDNKIIPDVLNKKFSRLDLLLATPEGQVNIEIQVNNYRNFKERTLFYWSKVFSDQLDEGEDYSKLQKTIAINIIDFNLFVCDEPHSSFMTFEKDRHELLTDKLRIDFLELKKANNSKNPKLREWLDFLSVTTEEGLVMVEKNTINPDIIGKAVAVIRKMSADEKLLCEIRKREETILNERSALNFAKNEGMAKGLSKGRAEGLSEGVIKGKIESINNLIKNNFSLADALKLIGIDEATYNSYKINS